MTATAETAPVIPSAQAVQSVQKPETPTPAATSPTPDPARIRSVQREWAGTPIRDRLAVLRRIRHAIAADPEPVARAAATLRGSPLPEKLAAECLPTADAIHWLERNAARVLAPVRHGAGGRPVWLAGAVAETRREPLGVILIIAPSNYPFMLAGVQAAQALAAGNAVIWKPGLGGLPSARAFAELAERAGLPAGLLTVTGESADEAVAAIEAGVDKVVLTGSARAGVAVQRRLADRLVPAVMELSGCDPVFVLPGADLDLVAKAVKVGLRFNGSETCIAPRRIIAPRSLAGDIESRLNATLSPLPARPVGSAAVDLAEELIAEAVAAGARRLTGKREGPELMTPTALADVRPGMRIASADLFAPVTSVIAVDAEGDAFAEAALRAAEPCPYALGASIFGPERAARELAGRVNAGSVCVNDMVAPTADPRIPFGGRGRSGFGTTRGPEGLLEMTALKTVSVRSAGFHQHLADPADDDAEFFRTYLRAAHSGSLLTRWGAWLRLLPMLIRRAWRG